MYTVEVSVPFEAAHILPLHSGKCKNLHGHNYILKAGFQSIDLNEQDMVIDFGEAKKIIKNYIDKEVDHALIVSCGPNEKLPPYQDKRYVIYDSRQPTAEVMSRHFYETLKYPYKLKLLKYIIIEETPGCFAKYEE